MRPRCRPRRSRFGSRAGACRPALAVGGDYYDFLELSSTQLGIAIGDVSGKGIPAALLMATLRASLRAQTLGGDKDIAEVMCNLNALVYESSATNRYATFFFGRYDTVARTLTYVNAGHHPPILFRACCRQPHEVVRLDIGGPVIGLLPTCDYQQGKITLEKDDVLLAFTDGINEAMNADDQEWGEERLIDAAIRRHGRSRRSLSLTASCRRRIPSSEARHSTTT